ncbi:cation:proton antiporter [Corynebacterium striatum]|nr:cation:proton antiporter [Corynebacterium striatum]
MLFALKTCPPSINLEIETVLTNEMIAINKIESKKEKVPKTTLNTPTVDINIALAVSNATTLSAVVGPFTNRNNVKISAIPNKIIELVIKKFISDSIILPPPI